MKLKQGDYVYWKGGNHPQAVWRIVPAQWKTVVEFVTGPPLPLYRKPWHQTVWSSDLTLITPLELLALMARTEAEWHPEVKL